MTARLILLAALVLAALPFGNCRAAPAGKPVR